MDEIDKANEWAAKLNEWQVAAARVSETLAATGECLYCGEELHGKRFCDADCRDEYDNEQRLLKARGKR